jgi:DNA repair exonuclease SbcCD nuclease subunit
MGFSFVHTADIHLDSPLKSLALRNPDLADLIGNATRTALSRIIDLCLHEQVNGLIIAGDLYDGAQTSMKTARFLAQELERLAQAGIAAFIIRGNHDAESKITRELVLPDTVKVFSGRPEVVETTWNGHAIALHGLSFRTPHAPDSLLDRYAAPLPDAFNIGILHTSLGGAPGHDPYAPCSVAQLRDTGYDYWALGHIHQRAEHTGPTTIVMPGNPQGRDIGEAGERSVTLVQVDDTGQVTLQSRSVAVARFDRVDVDCSGLTRWTDLVAALHEAVGITPSDTDHLILRPRLTGTTPLHWRATRDADLLLGEAQNSAERSGSVWIDKLEVALTEPGETRQTGALGDLAAMLDGDPLPPDDARVQAEWDMLRKHLPKELRNLLGEDAESEAQSLARETRAGAQALLAQLGTQED